METVTQELYNPHAFIAVRRINSETQENTFPLYKATDIETVLNRINLLEQRIEHQEKHWEAECSGLDPYYISDNVFDLGTGSIENVSALISKYKLDILVESDYEPTGYRR